MSQSMDIFFMCNGRSFIKRLLECQEPLTEPFGTPNLLGLQRSKSHNVRHIAFCYQDVISKMVEYNTIQLYCPCVEKFAFWLVMYIKHSVHLTIKHQKFSKTLS